jgi:hypothetical protein
MYMVKTQIQLPDELYRELKALAERKEWSLAEVLRRGAEYMLGVYPRILNAKPVWQPPEPLNLGGFKAPYTDWRELANERWDLKAK